MQVTTENEIENIYNQFRKPILRFISYKVADKHVAKEILNDVFFKASISLDSLKEQTKIQSWLYKIASNLVIDYYRKKKETYTSIEEFHLPQEEQEEIGEDMSCCFEKFLSKMPPQYANSLKAVYLEEYTQKEYALKNNINLSTVKSNVKRGKASMQKFFEQCCSFEKDNYNNIVTCTPYDKKTSCN